MKPTAHIWINSETKETIGLFDMPFNPPEFMEKDTTPLYTAHEIAEFVRGLYFDDNFRHDNSKNRFSPIADKIEEEGKK